MGVEEPACLWVRVEDLHDGQSEPLVLGVGYEEASHGFKLTDGNARSVVRHLAASQESRFTAMLDHGAGR